MGLEEGQCGGAERGLQGCMVGVETAKAAGLQGQAMRDLESLAEFDLCHKAIGSSCSSSF